MWLFLFNASINNVPNSKLPGMCPSSSSLHNNFKHFKFAKLSFIHCPLYTWLTPPPLTGGVWHLYTALGNTSFKSIAIKRRNKHLFELTACNLLLVAPLHSLPADFPWRDKFNQTES